MKPMTPEIAKLYADYAKNRFRGPVPEGVPIVFYPKILTATQRFFNEIPYWHNNELLGCSELFDSMNEEVEKFFDDNEGKCFGVRFEYDEECGERTFSHLFALDCSGNSIPGARGDGYSDGWSVIELEDFRHLLLMVFCETFCDYERKYDRPGYFLYGIADGWDGEEVDSVANRAFLRIFPTEKSRNLVKETYDFFD